MKWNWLRKATAALVSVATVAAVGIGLSAPAYADPASLNPKANEILISAPQSVDNSNLKVPQLTGRTFEAYKLADYAHVTTGKNTEGNPALKSIEYQNAGGVSDENVYQWIYDALSANPDVLTKAANNGEGTRKLADVVTINKSGATAKDKVKFIGDAAAMTPMNFVASYFYGSGADIYGNPYANNTLMRVFAESAQRTLATASGVVKVASDKITVNQDGTLATVETPSQGLYLIIDTTQRLTNQIPARAMVAGTPCTEGGVTYTFFDGENTKVELGVIKLKAEKVTNSTYIANADANKGALVAIGSERTFNTVTNIPNYAAYGNWNDQVFYVTFVPTSNIALDAKSVTVKEQQPGTTGWTVLNANWNVANNVANSPTGSVTVSFSDLKDSLSGAAVLVSIKGTVTNLTQNDTTVTSRTTFSNDSVTNSKSTNEGQVQDEVSLYDADVPLKKIAFNAETNSQALTGAQFTVTPEGNGAAALKFTTADYNGQPVFQVNTALNATGTTDRVTIGEGTVQGLAADTKTPVTYTFREVKAPDGYVLDATHAIQFTVRVTPNITAANQSNDEGVTNDVTLTGVSFYRQDGPNNAYANFLDKGEQEIANANNNPQGLSVDAQKREGNTAFNTHVVSSRIYVENTKNPSDFAQTGGTITKVLIAMLIIAIVGAVLLLIARQRRRSGAKTA